MCILLLFLKIKKKGGPSLMVTRTNSTVRGLETLAADPNQVYSHGTKTTGLKRKIRQ